MKYLDKSFSVSMSNVSQEEWDRIFRKPTTSVSGDVAPATSPDGELGVVTSPAPDFSARQCAACLETGQLEQIADGLLQCGVCLARFPIGVEQAQRVTGDARCTNCDGTGRLRTTFTVFACGACGGTGARNP